MSGLWERVIPRTIARGTIVMPGATIVEVFWNAVGARGDKVFMRQKALGLWESWSWRETGAIVREIAMGLVACGLAPGETAAVLANTRREWVAADLAILSAGGVTNGIYPTDAPGQVEYLCADSATRILFVEDDEQLDKALAVRARLPLLAKIVVFDMEGLARFADPMVTSLAALRALGREHDAAHPGEFDRRRASRGPRDLAMLIYTSGTTGKPKGAMHTHAGIMATTRGYGEVSAQDESDDRICFLPLCHIAERTAGEFFAIYAGARLNFVENPDTVAENVREISPTVFAGVPRVWEKLYSGVALALAEATRLEQLAYRWALGVGGRVADCVLAGRPVPASLRLAFRAAEFAVIRNARRMLGIDRARYIASAAAPISPELIRWYLSLGVPMIEAWGLTETCGASSFVPLDGIRLGTIGRACAYNEVKVDPQTGELLVRGPNVFAGYLNLPDKTAEAIDADGWLHTGDVGSIDADGYLRITDRMKDIIITAGGKNVTPSELENELKFSPYVTDAVVIGDRRPYLVALVMIDQENVEKFAQDRDVAFSNYASLTRAPEVRELIASELERVNRKFARVEQIKKFRLIETQLAAEDEELTPTMKLKRKLVERKYAELIESMYNEA